MTTPKSDQPILSPGLLREAMTGSNRRSRLETAEAEARFAAEKARIEGDFRKKYKIATLEKAVHDIECSLKNAEHDLEVATQQMHEAMSEKIAQLQEKKADSLALIAFNSTRRDFGLLSLTLPKKACDILELDKLNVSPKAALVMNKEE